MAINFPNSPVSGDTHTVSGKIWQWDGEKWKAYGASIAPSILKIDTANNRVGINQTTPTVALDVTGAMRVTGDLTIEGTTTTIESTTIAAQTSLTFEGATADDFETTLTLVDPTADRTITLPNNTGTVALTTDNVASATALATARTIGGTSFDGTAAIVPGTITVADTTDTTAFVGLWESATGDLAPKSDAGLTYNAGTGTLSAVTSLGGFSGPAILNIPTNEGSNFTLAADDAGAFVRINNASANTVTVPPNSAVAYPIGTQIILCTLNAGVTTITPGSGVSLYSQGNASANSGDLKIDGQYATAALVKTLTDQWHVFGKLNS